MQKKNSATTVWLLETLCSKYKCNRLFLCLCFLIQFSTFMTVDLYTQLYTLLLLPFKSLQSSASYTVFFNFSINSFLLKISKFQIYISILQPSLQLCCLLSPSCSFIISSLFVLQSACTLIF